MYNKSELSKALKEAKAAKSQKKTNDVHVDIRGNGYKNPKNSNKPALKLYTDSIYNPTDKDLMLYPDNGMEPVFKPAWDTTTTYFPGANSIIEKQVAEDGGTIMDLTDKEIEQYRNAGYVVNQVPSMQPGGSATESDSSKVYNNAINVLNFYKNSGNYDISRREPSSKDWWNDIITERDRLNNSFKGFTSKVKVIGKKPDGTLIYKETPTNKVWSKPGPDPNKIYARETSYNFLNLNAPMSLYDRRIAPQYRVQADEKKGVLPNDAALISMYDPLAIAPAVKLSDAEIIKRYKKFGASGIPKSRLIKLGLIKDPSPKQSPVSLSFVPPTITDLEFEPPIEPETQWTNPNPEMDVEQRPQEPKTYIPEFKRQYRHNPRNFSNLWGLKPRYGHWVDVPVEADGGNIDPGNNALELHMFYDKDIYQNAGTTDNQQVQTPPNPMTYFDTQTPYTDRSGELLRLDKLKLQEDAVIPYYNERTGEFTTQEGKFTPDQYEKVEVAPGVFVARFKSSFGDNVYKDFSMDNKFNKDYYKHYTRGKEYWPIYSTVPYDPLLQQWRAEDATEEPIVTQRKGGYVNNQITHFQYGGIPKAQMGRTTQIASSPIQLTDELNPFGSLYYNPLDNNKFIENQPYTYAGRPGSYYKMVDGKMHIKNKDTDWKYVEMKDPTGKRLKTLEAGLKSGSTKVFNKPKATTTINDFYYSKNELQNQQVAERAGQCLREADGNCLGSAFRYYDKYVAPKLGMQSSWELKESAGLTSGKKGANPNYDAWGESVDSWELRGAFGDKAKQYYAAPLSNPSELYQKLEGMTEAERDKYFRDMNLPIGTIITGGMGGYDENKFGSWSSYNEKKGYVASHHSGIVVGYDDYGTPIIYDYGNVRKISDPANLLMTSDYPINNIFTPQENVQYTYDYLKKGNKLKQQVTPLSMNMPGMENISDIDEMGPFLDNLEKNKQKIMDTFDISDSEYNELARISAATALAETKGGQDLGTWRYGVVPAYLTDKLGMGESQGITQINPESVWSKDEQEAWRNPQLVNRLSQLGITRDTYDPWNPYHQAVVTMGLTESNIKAAKANASKNPNVSKDLSDAELAYYQWNIPSALTTTDYEKAARGDNENVKRFMEYYNMLNRPNRQTGGTVEYLTQDEINQLRAGGITVIEE